MADTDGLSEDLSVVVRFVIPSGKCEVTVSKALSHAFEQSKEAGLSPVWVQEEEVLNISPTKTVTFINGELVSHFNLSGESLDRGLYYCSISNCFPLGYLFRGTIALLP